MITIQFLLGESRYSNKAVDYMLAIDDHANALLDDDDDDFLLYAEAVKADDEFDEDGNEIDPFRHYDELEAEILRQAAEKGITDAIKFQHG